MKVFSAGLVISTALTAAALALATPSVLAQNLMFGAYDPRQQETLWSEAISLQDSGQHSEAIEKLKRAGHLSRINEGLNAKSQLPYLRAEIASHRALNQLALADERQAYLSRIESTTIPSGPEKVEALLAQAEWHQYALLQDIDEEEESTARMGKAWNFYRRALNESIATYGEDSEELIPALEGMVRAQYLLASHRGIGAAMPGKMDRDLRNYAAGKSTFKRGLSVLVAMQHLNRDRLGVSREIQADDLIRMGDWAWWTGNRMNAISFYQDALTLANGETLAVDTGEVSVSEQAEVAVESDAVEGDIDSSIEVTEATGDMVDAVAPQAPITSKDEESSPSELVTTDNLALELAETDGEPSENALAELPTELFPTFRILNAPVALPAVPGFGPVLDIKQGEPAEGDLVVSFNISATGKAINLERIQFPVTEGARGPERVIRRLRKMRFRPVFEDGEPVESERMTWVFEPKHWAMPRATATESST
ncbi:MAG: energy transducer TonB [Luminiphilus sp.]